MTHLWLRAEHRPHEARTGLTPEGTAALVAQGIQISVEDSAQRILPTQDYAAAGASIVPEGSWPDAPPDAIILGLKELPESDAPLRHRHIMFGHAYKDQSGAKAFLARFTAGGGALYDLEYLTDENGRRLAAFGYWAGYAGAAVSLMAWVAQMQGGICGPVGTYPDKDALDRDLRAQLDSLAAPRPSALAIGALGRVGSGAVDLCHEMGIRVTRWDQAETASGGPFPEILDHTLFFNCILAQEGCPVFVPPSATSKLRALRVIGDIACDPSSPFNPVQIYDRATDWAEPVLRVAQDPPLDVMAIDNLPSMLPREASEDFAAQLLPALAELPRIESAPAWARAHALFQRHATAG